MSTTVSASNSKSTDPILRSWTQLRAGSKPKASPTQTSHIGENNSILTNTKAPRSSLIQTLILTLYFKDEKEATTLHLNFSVDGLLHLLQEVAQ